MHDMKGIMCVPDLGRYVIKRCVIAAIYRTCYFALFLVYFFFSCLYYSACIMQNSLCTVFLAYTLAFTFNVVNSEKEKKNYCLVDFK